MIQVVLLCVLMMMSTVTAMDPVHLQELDSDTFNGFIQSEDGVRVVYFYSQDFVGIKKFFTEMEKSAAIMEIYDAKFALVNCLKHSAVGYCNQKDSFSRVYMYKKGRMLLDVSKNALFDVHSIISNVLQVVLLIEVPILQSLPEFEQLQSQSKGNIDVIFSYQKALGTYSHRILMEVIYSHRSKYRFGITNEQATVEQLNGYSPNEENGVWFLRCKEVTESGQSCPVVKYTGPVVLENLAQFFRVLDLTFIHDIGEDGDYNPFEDNKLHSVYIFYDKHSQFAATNIAKELTGVFYTLLGTIMVNINEVNASKYGYNTEWTIPALAVKPAGQNVVHHMKSNDIPIRFIAETIGSIVPALHIITDTPNEMPKNSDHVLSETDADDSEDDEVAELGSRLKKAVLMNKMHYFTELTGSSYQTTINDDRPLMLLYYVAFDANCQVFLPVFDDAASSLTNQELITMAAINCFDWTDICQHANVTTYPTINIHLGKDRVPVQYKGMLSKKAVLDTVKLYVTETPMVLRSIEELDKFVATTADTVVFGGFHTVHNNEVITFNKSASDLHGKLLHGLALDDVAIKGCSRFNVEPPCVVVIRHDDIVTPHTVLNPAVTSDELINSILLAQLNSFPELTVSNFPQYNSNHQPFIIAFVSSEANDLVSTLRTLLKDGRRVNNAIYSWMDVSKSEIAKTILRHHIEKPHDQELLVIDRCKGTVNQFTGVMTPSTIHDWLADVISGNIQANKFLTVNDWKPRVAPFDFLAKIDAESSGRDDPESANDELDERDVRSPFELLDSNVKKEVEMEMSRLTRAQLHGSKLQDDKMADKQTQRHKMASGRHDEF